MYSVCYHHGTDILGGHYTSSCKNPTDGQWYAFDDTHTKQIGEEEVVNKDAYILFYQKACLSPAAASSSSSSSTSSGAGSGGSTDHWVYRMPDFVYKTKNETRCAPHSKPRTNKSTTVGGGSTHRLPNSASFARNSSKYATLPASSARARTTAADLVRRRPAAAAGEEDDAATQSDAENGTRSGVESSDEEEEEVEVVAVADRPEGIEDAS